MHTSIYDKRVDMNFHITNFPFLRSYISSSSAYGVFISQLIRFTRACFSYVCFILRTRRLSSKQLKQGYLVERLKSSFSGRFIVNTGILFSNMKYPSHECSMTLRPSTSYINFPTDQIFHQFHDLDTEFDLRRITSGFHGAFATDVACQQGTLTLSDTLLSSLSGTCLYSNCWDQFSRTCRIFSRLLTLNIPGYFLVFAYVFVQIILLTCNIRIYVKMNIITVCLRITYLFQHIKWWYFACWRKELPRVNRTCIGPSWRYVYWISFIIIKIFLRKIIRFTIIPNGKWKSFLNHWSPNRYRYSRLAWLFIHKRSWHNKWGPVSRGGGGGGNVIHDFWYMGKGIKETRY